MTGLVLLTASSALTVHGESDNTIDVTLFKLNLPDDWSYDPNDISDYEYFMTMQTALLKKQPLVMWIIYEPQTILTEFTTFIVTSHPV